MDIKPTLNPHIPISAPAQVSPSGGSGEAWEGRSIAGPKLRLCDFSAFLEQQRDSETVSKRTTSWRDGRGDGEGKREGEGKKR